MLALIDRVPCRLFARTHRWIAIACLALVFHSVVLLKSGRWGQPVGWLLAALMAAGSVAALVSLSGRIGAGRQVAGRIESLQHDPELHVLVDGRDGRLDGKRIRAAVSDWAEASVWFCGPPAFGRTLGADLRAQGLPADRFHQERFEMR